MVGSLAPGFDLPCTARPDTQGRRAALADFRGRWLALVFYPRDFSLVCPTELTALGARIDEFRRQGCEVLGISCDPIESHEQWIETPRSRGGLEDLGFALAADEDGEVTRAYGVYLEHQHAALRGLFLIDPNGVLQYMTVHNLSVGRRPDDVLRVLTALQTGGLCASTWEVGDPTVDPTQVLGPGSMVGHYRVEAPVGSGSFAAVFRARDLRLQRSVALKVLKPGATRYALAEARSAASLSHPNIGTIYAVEDSDGVAMIAMEYLRGPTLRRLIDREGALPPDRAAEIARQVASGLAAAHAHGLSHGDFKPDNVIVTHEGPAKILDFGLARLDDRDPDATLDFHPDEAEGEGGDDAEAVGVFGTPSYMAPEQTRGERASPAGDVFAFGVVLHEMLTGRKAFPGDNVLKVLASVRAVDPARLAADLPEPFSTIVRRALEPDPSRRSITMSEIVELLS
jgi:alkyl hydroperoxide reductase subunit AhpC/predicted Ser/Thr protein kinase